MARAHEEPENAALGVQRLAPNGLPYRAVLCRYCGRCPDALADGVLLGCFRWRCHTCKQWNVVEINRVGEEQMYELLRMEYRREHGDTSGQINGRQGR